MCSGNTECLGYPADLVFFLFIYLLFEKNQSKKPAVGIRSELFQLISKTDAIFSTFFSGAPSYRTRHKQ